LFPRRRDSSEEDNDNNLIEINNLNTDWNLLVDKIELFETECKKSKHLHINYLTLMEEKLSLIDLNLNNLNPIVWGSLSVSLYA
jgi:hypothetical protein